MPFFALEDGRARPVHPDRGQERPWDAGTAARIAENVLDLLGVPVLPIAWRQDDATLDPYLVALDSTGAAVVVLTHEVLDGATLVSALARSAAVRMASWREVAGWYDAGPDALRADWAAFRESVPPRGEAAPGLLVVAGAIADDVRAAVGVLDAATVLVREVSLREHEGREVLAVEDVTPARFAARHQVLEVESAGGVDVATIVGGVGAPLAALVAAPPVEAGDAVAVETDAADATDDADADAVETDAADADADATRPAAEPAGAPEATPTDDSGTRRRRRHGVTPLSPPDAEGLTAVVGLVGEAQLTLVVPGARDVSATLAADGSLEVDGRTFHDPAEAAAAVVGEPVPDGWAAWRFGPDGPFLGEALEEALAPRRRPLGRGNRRRAVRR